MMGGAPGAGGAGASGKKGGRRGILGRDARKKDDKDEALKRAEYVVEDDSTWGATPTDGKEVE